MIVSDKLLSCFIANYIEIMKNYIVRIYFSKSYLKPHVEYHIDVLNSEKSKVISKLTRRHYDMFREEIINN